jgi:hypothetical protein
VFALCAFFFAVALGPNRWQAWVRAISDSYHYKDRELDRLRTENEKLRDRTWESAQPEEPPQERDDTAMGEFSRRFDAEVRQKFLNRYMDEAKALRAENLELRRGLDAPREGSAYPGSVQDDAFAEAFRIVREIRGEAGDEEELRWRSRELADELRQFLEDNENLNEEQIMKLYNRSLGDKASALLEELEERDLYPPLKP